MRVVIDRQWCHAICEELTAVNYQSVIPEINNYDIIEAILTGMVIDTYYDIQMDHRRNTWTAHVKSELLSIFRKGLLKLVNIDRSDRLHLSSDFYIIAEEVLKIKYLDELYEFIWATYRDTNVDTVERIEFVNDTIIIRTNHTDDRPGRSSQLHYRAR
jgi:hypothetical protein